MRTQRRKPATKFRIASVFRILFDIAPHAQQIAAPDLLDLLRTESALAQTLRQVVRFRGVEPASDAAATIEIRSQADVIDAGDVDHVADVIEIIVERGQWELLLDAAHAFLV